MPLATLTDVLTPARAEGSAVLGAVVLGWEDAEAYVAAAEEAGAPIILQAGPKFRTTLPPRISGLMFRTLGEAARIPVVAHLDHAKSIDECRIGIDAGFTSVMYDGSALPLDENIANTLAVIDLARPHGVSVEAEIGFVGYAGEMDEGVQSTETASTLTDPGEAGRLARETGCDALAISIGNLHLQQTEAAAIDLNLLAAIEAVTECPLVLHGASGVAADMRRHLARHSRICKFNIGTELRQGFGAELRAVLAENPHIFDRGEILAAVKPPLTRLAADIIRSFRI